MGYGRHARACGVGVLSGLRLPTTAAPTDLGPLALRRLKDSALPFGVVEGAN